MILGNICDILQNRLARGDFLCREDVSALGSLVFAFGQKRIINHFN